MTIPESLNLNDTEALSRLLRQNRILRSKFCLETDYRTAANGIWASYATEVRLFGNKPEQKAEILDHIAHAARWLIAPHGKPGLLLQGYKGNGKTTLMNAVVHMLEFISRVSEPNLSKRLKIPIVEAKEVCAMSVRYPDDYKNLCNSRMLAIDDVGDEPAVVTSYGMDYTPLRDLFNQRYKLQLFTIATTNLSGDEIERHYGERIRDRFREHFEQIVFTGDSFRGNKNTTYTPT